MDEDNVAESLARIEAKLDEIELTQESIVKRMDRAENITAPANKIAEKVKGSIITLVGWVVIVGVISVFVLLVRMAGLDIQKIMPFLK
jgi:hypothetical protein